MPNSFMPKDLSDMVREQTATLDDFSDDSEYVKRWHGLLTMLTPEKREEFYERYSNREEIPIELIEEHSDGSA